ncbi:8907_t:CDS:1 [Entrophospora sp. SA101]|nr:8907_t:CDS:1 [Entrophospora sp. SA101]
MHLCPAFSISSSIAPFCAKKSGSNDNTRRAQQDFLESSLIFSLHSLHSNINP